MLFLDLPAPPEAGLRKNFLLPSAPERHFPFDVPLGLLGALDGRSQKVDFLQFPDAPASDGKLRGCVSWNGKLGLEEGGDGPLQFSLHSRKHPWLTSNSGPPWLKSWLGTGDR